MRYEARVTYTKVVTDTIDARVDIDDATKDEDIDRQVREAIAKNEGVPVAELNDLTGFVIDHVEVGV